MKSLIDAMPQELQIIDAVEQYTGNGEDKRHFLNGINWLREQTKLNLKKRKGVMYPVHDFESALTNQFIAAGDTQWVNKEKQGDQAVYHVNKLWLKNFYKIITESGLPNV